MNLFLMILLGILYITVVITICYAFVKLTEDWPRTKMQEHTVYLRRYINELREEIKKLREELKALQKEVRERNVK